MQSFFTSVSLQSSHYDVLYADVKLGYLATY